LKGARALPIYALDQLIFFRNNAYFVTQKRNAYDYIARGKLWSSIIIQLELDANIFRSRDHIIVLFNVDDDIFMVHSPYKSSDKIQILV